MTTTQPLVRTRVYLTSEHLLKCKVLADRYHTNRSEVIRVALDHGLDLVAKDLRRLQRARVARPVPVPGSLAPPTTAPTTADLGDQLREYADTVLGVDPGRSEGELRLLLTTHAKLLQVPADELEDVVDEVITMLPSTAHADVESEDGVQRREPPA